MTLQEFRRIVWAYYKKEGRHDLPWRKTTDPYRILVSEIMLQQTQVERVKPYYQNWLKKFPTAHALANAPLGDVLRAWQGLGYNRRAKMLHTAAKSLSPFPKSAEELQKLPGIGPYTARAVMAFAHNSDEVFIETNIRTAVTHHFFPRRKTVDDREVLAVLEKAHPHGKAREWYAALMDYGAHLKRSGVRLNAKAKGYAKQKTFAGSDRQARGAILKELAKAPAAKSRLLNLLGDDRRQQLEAQLAKLLAEGMVTRKGTAYRLP